MRSPNAISPRCIRMGTPALEMLLPVTCRRDTPLLSVSRSRHPGLTKASRLHLSNLWWKSPNRTECQEFSGCKSRPQLKHPLDRVACFLGTSKLNTGDCFIAKAKKVVRKFTQAPVRSFQS